MADRLLHTQGMEEGANQGLPISASLAALVLQEVLKLLDASLKVRVHKRFLDNNCDNGGDGEWGESYPVGYIDDCRAAIPHKDMLFFFEEFNRLSKLLWYYLNPYRMRIIILMSKLSSLLATTR